jgi:alkylhydroperoxidase family enzyme
MTPSQREQYDRFPSNLSRALLLADERLARLPPELANALRASAFDPKLREAVILRIARLSGSAYERMQHFEQAQKAGFRKEHINAIERGDALGHSETLSAVLAFAEECVASPKVSDVTFDRVAKLLSSRDIVTLLLLIGHYMTMARLLETLEVELDPKPDSFAKEH